ncbi:DUF3108 domain-containing protein [Acetobacter sp. TBRC 12305]|uniref:DUF3108 domain-containing protein n=1 Tax=Acetobacter garciniae TaxID=2817435 RepID=A0A939HQ48_9PROT|nr:DUF3108 domain-containing protein [Acetobacter garciniae]MBO1325837.1 DUF3108 domain-containing protein [Acetobacter garciniae]MBX0345737.1 DUF3108 domain-containing protein [Acetobacter garciniae]
MNRLRAFLFSRGSRPGVVRYGVFRRAFPARLGKGGLLAGLLAACVMQPAAGAGATETLPQNVARYHIYAHGLELMALDTAYRLGADQYSVSAAARTGGLVGLFVKSSLRMSGMGTFTPDGTVTPQFYKSDGRSHHQDWLLNMGYPKGMAEVTEENPTEADREPVTLQDKVGAVDMLATFMGVLHQVQAAHRCTDTPRKIFDGLRLSTLSMSDAGIQRLPEGTMRDWGADGLRCNFVLQQVQGFKVSARPSKLRQPQPGQVWFEDVPQVGLVVVRLELEHPKLGHIVIQLEDPPRLVP